MTKKLLLLFGLLCIGLQAQVTSEKFDSYILQDSRQLQYFFPEDYTEEKKYPLILVLDAEYLFDMVVANAKFYGTYQRMPEAIIVGVNQVSYDLRWEDCDFEQTTGLPTDNAQEFYDFIGKELIPYLEGTYSIAPFKMFIGYDITANFGNYFLFEDQSIFNSYLIISPLLATEMEARVPARLTDLKQQIFYNLVLEKENTEDRNRILQMDRAITSIDKENIRYFFDQYEEPDHTSIAAYGISKAFDNVFKIFRPISPKEYKEKILTSDQPVFQYLLDKYAMIENLLGFEKEIELNDVMAIYAGVLKKEDYESLGELAKLCKKTYPETMLGFYFEGEYLEYIGEPKKAKKAFEKSFLMEEIDFLTKEMAIEKIDALKADFGY
ncbi:alpha/beta hydrolase [Croceivirga thetidis]|uniref:Esterase n=1 Tax=Croceivirga thetidis TaxID=2721623 RepID=A0ABX1GQZ0_9FLAO|nr:alpha/beta hydrolase-fold protein [Croceivirga thetidis]NKI31480.1 esterase [Croceivirga thetidis]